MKFKNILLGLGTITAVIAPMSSVIACGTKKLEPFVSAKEMAILQKHEFTHRNDKFDLTPFATTTLLKDAVIEEWIDGDTPIVTLDGEKGVHIRVTSIDTPELHIEGKDGKINVETTGSEYDWAMKAKKFGEKVMPVGTHVKLFTNGAKSYERVVGSFFYKENASDTEYTSYAVEMLRRGLATSFVSDISLARTHSSVLNLNGLALADAYNYALKTSAGLFGTDIINILRIHGITSDLPIRWTGVKYDRDSYGVKNIYDVLHAV